MRAGAELRGSCESFSCAAKRSSIEAERFLMMAFSRERLPVNRLAIRRRRLFFSTELVFAMSETSFFKQQPSTRDALCGREN
jgi:hypothetical protein